MATETAIFGAGCFWGVEASFRKLEGVTETEVGYAGGHVDEPSYQMVCTGQTGHAEVVRVRFDPERVRYDDLLNVFWDCHDATQLNRQGPDIGTQYRSAIYYDSPEQQKSAEDSKARQNERHGGRIVTEITPASTFWRAEDYHQQYFEKQGGRRFGLF